MERKRKPFPSLYPLLMLGTFKLKTTKRLFLAHDMLKSKLFFGEPAPISKSIE
ncbi:MAG TPA: hypothetical protein VIH27_07225 [Nitrososphaerales archaeon]